MDMKIAYVTDWVADSIAGSEGSSMVFGVSFGGRIEVGDSLVSSRTQGRYRVEGTSISHASRNPIFCTDVWFLSPPVSADCVPGYFGQEGFNLRITSVDVIVETISVKAAAVANVPIPVIHFGRSDRPPGIIILSGDLTHARLSILGEGFDFADPIKLALFSKALGVSPVFQCRDMATSYRGTTRS